MNCPDCDVVMIEQVSGSGRYLHPGSPDEETPRCPVMLYNRVEGRLWYVYGHKPRYKEVKL